MAAGKGSSFLLKDNSTGTPATVGGLRSTSMTINGEAVDITTKDSNAFISSGNDKARDLLQGGGVEVCQSQQVVYLQIHQQKTS